MAEEQAQQEQQAAAAEATEGSLLDDIVQATKLKPNDDYYDVTKAGLQAFLEELVKPEREGAKISGNLVDEMIGQIDEKLSSQIDAILHNDDFQKLESAWLSLKFLVDRTDFRENIKVEIMNVSKDDLLDDFEDSPEVPKSGLYRRVYTAEYGQFGGQPYGAMIANYEIGPGPQDIKLLQYVASVSAMSHAPFFAAADKSFFGIESWEQLPQLKDLHAIFEMPQYTKWQSFRSSEDARYVGLTMPRFLLRLPYGPDTQPTKTFNYQENVSGGNDSFCWGNTAFAFASRLTDSFAKYRWCANIIGPQGGGAVEDLPLYQFEAMGAIQTKIPTEVLLSERREFELAEEGFIGLTMRKGSDNAALLLRELLPETEILRQLGRRQGSGAQLQTFNPDALHDDQQPPGALHQSAAAREHRHLERTSGSRPRTEQMDQPVRHGNGQPVSGCPEQTSVADVQNRSQRCSRRSRLVQCFSENASAFQVHGCFFHLVFGRQTGQRLVSRKIDVTFVRQSANTLLRI